MKIYFYYYFITGIISFISILYISFFYKKSSIWIQLFLSSIGIYALGYSIQLFSNDLDTALFWWKVQYLGIVFYTSFILLASLEYVNKKNNKLLQLFLLTCPLIFLTIFYINPNFMFNNIKFENSTIIFENGIIYWIECLYDFIVGGAGILIFIKGFLNSAKFHKKIVKLIIIMGVLVLVVGFVNLSNKTRAHNTMVFFVTSPVYMLGYVIFGLKMFKYKTIFLDKVFENSPIEIIVLNNKFIVIDENNSALNSFGKLLGKKISELSNFLFLQMSKKNNEINNLKIFGKIYNINISEYKNNKEIIGYILNFSDISKLKEAEIKLSETNDNLLKLSKEKEELTLTISHDLRTPLNGIMGMSELTLLNKLDDETSKNIKIINNSSKYMLKLLNEILLSKQNETLKKFSIKELLNELSYSFKKMCMDKNIFYFTYCSFKIPKNLKGNYEKIKQVLFNIIGNAIKYTEKGGVLIKAEVNLDKTGIIITIEDTGIGISNIEKIYELYYTEENKEEDFQNVNNKSFGIGLYNTKKIIDSLNGKINVKSEKNRGSIFELEFELNNIDEDIIYNFNIKKEKEVVVISDFKILNKFLSNIFNEFKINFYLFDSYKEYEDFYDFILEEKIIFITDNKIENLNKISKKTINDNEKAIILSENDKSIFKDYINLNIKNISDTQILEELDIEFKNNIFIDSEKIKKDIPEYNKLSALIIEDNLLNILYLERILIKLKIKYNIAKTIKEAGEFINKMTYDIIFSDIYLDESNIMSFIKKSIEDNNINSVKIALTASVSKNMKIKCFEAGFDEFIEKPYSINDILRIFDKYFFKFKISKSEEKKALNMDIEYYNIFLSTIDEELAKLDDYIQNRNLDKVNKLIHKLKGGSQILKEKLLIKNLLKIEELLDTEDISEILAEIIYLKDNIFSIRKRVNYENSSS